MPIDVVFGGALMNKPYPEACVLIEDMAQNHYQWGTERVQVEKKETKGGIYKVSSFRHMNAKMDALTQKVESLVINPTATVAAGHPGCKIYGTLEYVTVECSLLAEINPDQANYALGNPYSNTYNPGWRNHPNLSYKNNNPTFSQTLLLKDQQNKEFMNQNIHINELISQLRNNVDSVVTHNKMLETQIYQVAQQQAAQATPEGLFPGQPQPNSKGYANVISLQSGTQYDGAKISEPPKENFVTTPKKQKEEPAEPEKQREKDINDKEAMNDNQEN
ncbi:uncharacterized protein LOC127088160 [Lathyrus oleraceus]|uniref:uncharacterized protein LOC127088160 n=1 Tax=Pisum sativum TaxID=3888 RepID=UPI0021D0E168|nr:uncharacterized protein LOC127088160 [Pisum sativum]